MVRILVQGYTVCTVSELGFKTGSADLGCEVHARGISNTPWLYSVELYQPSHRWLGDIYNTATSKGGWHGTPSRKYRPGRTAVVYMHQRTDGSGVFKPVVGTGSLIVGGLEPEDYTGDVLTSSMALLVS